MTPPSSAFVSAWLTDLAFDWSPCISSARRRSFASEEPLFHQGQPADTVFVIQEGRLRLTTFSADGKERHLMILGATGLAGDCGLPSHPHYAVTAVGATSGVAIALSSAAFFDLLQAHPLLARQHAELHARRFRILVQQLELQGPNSGVRRVCHHLLGLLGSYGVPHIEGTLIGITFTQQEMANLCGLSRVSVAQTLSQLERSGLIGRVGRQVVVRDLPRLHAKAI